MDTTAIADRMVQKGVPVERASRAVSLYETLVEVAAENPHETLVPPRVADEAWHEHQAMSSYADDCVSMCGRVLPHDPSVHGTPEFWAAWEATRRLFADRGIELPAQGEEDSAPDLQAETCVLWGASSA